MQVLGGLISVAIIGTSVYPDTQLISTFEEQSLGIILSSLSQLCSNCDLH